MKKKSILLLVILISLLLVGCGAEAVGGSFSTEKPHVDPTREVDEDCISGGNQYMLQSYGGTTELEGEVDCFQPQWTAGEYVGGPMFNFETNQDLRVWVQKSSATGWEAFETQVHPAPWKWVTDGVEAETGLEISSTEYGWDISEFRVEKMLITASFSIPAGCSVRNAPVVLTAEDVLYTLSYVGTVSWYEGAGRPYFSCPNGYERGIKVPSEILKN